MSEHVQAITADFAQAVDPPLVRKFGMMNSGLVALDRHRRDLHLMDTLRPDSFRMDLCWGEPRMGWTQEPVGGTATAPRYHFVEMDELVGRLNSMDVLPYWSYCYTPPPLQHPDWQSVPSDLGAWGRVLHDFARHYRDARLTVGYHEVYNEPDLPGVFFTGKMQDYFDMYARGARGLKVGDPDARVGGPALADMREWTGPFLEFVTAHDLPLDFFSFHVLNGGLPQGTLRCARERLAQLRAEFGESERFQTTEVHINEYHPYEYAHTRRGGAADKFPLAARILSDMAGLLEETDLTLVHWAQFMGSLPGVADEGMGLVDLDGHRKAAYHAFQIYARMPIDRRHVIVEGGLRALASADDGRASLVLWNETGRDEHVAVRLGGVPFTSGELRVYRIDGEHASYGDDPHNEELEATEPLRSVGAPEMEWAGRVPNGGVVYLEVNRARPPVVRAAPPARVRHVRRFYPQRGTSSYADFDRRSWTVRLGMGSETAARELIGIVAEDWPARLEVAFEVTANPELRRDDGVLGVRIDFAAGGADTTSVLLHDGTGAAASSIPVPWGTRRAPDRTVFEPDLSALSVPLEEFAPPQWQGRTTVTFLMQHLGPGARAKVTIRRSP